MIIIRIIIGVRIPDLRAIRALGARRALYFGTLRTLSKTLLKAIHDTFVI